MKTTPEGGAFASIGARDHLLETLWNKAPESSQTVKGTASEQSIKYESVKHT